MSCQIKHDFIFSNRPGDYGVRRRSTGGSTRSTSRKSGTTPPPGPWMMTRRTTSPTSSGRRSEWGSWRRGPWRSWWSPWPVTPGSSSPPTSMSSSPPTGPLLQQNKSLTSSRRGKWNKFYFKTFMLRVFVRTFLPSVLIMVMYSYIALKWTCVTWPETCRVKKKLQQSLVVRRSRHGRGHLTGSWSRGLRFSVCSLSVWSNVRRWPRQPVSETWS